MDR
ncbi:hypothetical protein D043_3778A, partial [Vibrio parahaemolyticus EKP-021]|jgi:hypothetical protein